MHATDVFKDLPALQAALRTGETPPEVALAAKGWETIFLIQNPGFRDWIIWHHRILLRR